MGQEEAMEEELSVLFPRNHSQTRGILKNPQIFKHEKCEQICFTQKSATTTVEAKSLVPFTAESRNLKSRQTCNRTSAPLDKSKKNYIFATRARAVAVSQRKSSFFLALSRCSQRLERDYTKI